MIEGLRRHRSSRSGLRFDRALAYSDGTGETAHIAVVQFFDAAVYL